MIRWVRWNCLCAMGAALGVLAPVARAVEVGTGFTYQGRLVKDGLAVGAFAPETCLITFGLWDAAAGGGEVGLSPFGPLAVEVSKGLFTVTLDFGPGAITGEARWLEITVECPGDAGATVLAPRQKLSPAPHALALPGLFTLQDVFSPNLIGGNPENEVGPGVSGATISGGGAVMPDNNRVTDTFGTVGGGCSNQAGDGAGTPLDAQFATVGGGFQNASAAPFATVGGGVTNNTKALAATIGGGLGNVAGGSFASVGGGSGNEAGGTSSTVAGGRGNRAAGVESTVAGGFDNLADAFASAIGGGVSNRARGDYSIVAGGTGNVADARAATVVGGEGNAAGGAYSLAGGRRAQVRDAAGSGDADGDEGTFVWADATDADFVSSGPNQFLIRAGGGVGINTNAPAAALHIGGVPGVDGLRFPDGTLQTTAAVDSDTLAALACADGEIAKWNEGAMQWVCAADESGSAGLITSVNAGTGLTGGGTMGDVTLSIAAGGVGATELADGAVESSKLAAGAVDHVHLADDAVTGDKIADGTITSADLGAGSVGEDELASGAVTAVKIAANAINSSKIQDETVGTVDLANGSVTSIKIATGAVGSAAIEDDSVSHLDLLNDSASLLKVSGGVLYSNGLNIGVGVPAPSVKLDVAGNIKSSGTIQSGSSIILNGTSTPNTISTTSGNDLRLVAGAASEFLQMSSATGNVGLGAAPSSLAQLQITTSLFTERALLAENTSTTFDVAAIEGKHQSLSNGRGVGVDGIGGYIGTRGQASRSDTATFQDAYGVYGEATGGHSSRTSYGVFGLGQGNGFNVGVFGTAGSGTTNWAGFFSGNVNVTGTLSKGGGTFRIDHPLDPENMLLYHSFVESPDMMNVYNGNITTDESGYATVELPQYFEALNRDFRYQLTVIDEDDDGTFAQVKVVRGVENNRFRIRSSAPGVRVSWQVTGIRRDAFAEANRVRVEVPKSDTERGRYVHPEAFGLPAERGMDYHRPPQPEAPPVVGAAVQPTERRETEGH